MAPRAHDLDLAGIWLFSNCSAADRKTLRQSLVELTVAPGKVLCKEGAVGREFFIIVEGNATVARGGRKVTTLGPGDFFGEMALLDRKPRSATVVSVTEMKLLVLSNTEFNAVLDAVPSLSRKMLSATAARLREADTLAFH